MRITEYIVQVAPRTSETKLNLDEIICGAASRQFRQADSRVDKRTADAQTSVVIADLELVVSFSAIRILPFITLVALGIDFSINVQLCRCRILEASNG